MVYANATNSSHEFGYSFNLHYTFEVPFPNISKYNTNTIMNYYNITKGFWFSNWVDVDK